MHKYLAGGISEYSINILRSYSDERCELSNLKSVKIFIARPSIQARLVTYASCISRHFSLAWRSVTFRAIFPVTRARCISRHFAISRHFGLRHVVSFESRLYPSCFTRLVVTLERLRDSHREKPGDECDVCEVQIRTHSFTIFKEKNK